MSDDGFFQQLVNLSTVAVVVIRPDGTISYVSPRAAKVLGARRHTTLEGGAFEALFAPSSAQALSAYLESVAQLEPGQSRWHEAVLDLDGEARVVELDGVNQLASPAVAGLVMTVSDVTEQRRRDEELQRAAMTDPLTGLTNRTGLSAKLDLLARKPPGAGCVALLDLDGFKAINDQLGHQTGDEVLRRAALCMRQVMRQAAGIARIGGDEFVAVLRGVTGDEAREHFEKLLAALLSLDPVNGHQIAISASVGIAETDGSATGGQLLQRADMAMYRAKAKGKSSIWVHRADDNDLERRREEELRSTQVERDRAAREARTDSLTGLPNARAYHEQLVAVEAMARLSGEHCAVVFYDADDFHTLNRQRGDAVGDAVLRQLAGIFSECCRSGDRVYRKGGEEFVAFLPGATIAEALEVAERTRKAVLTAAIPTGAPRNHVTISVGVACYHPELHRDTSEAVEEAAQAMKLAKDAGRNRVRTGGPCAEPSQQTDPDDVTASCTRSARTHGEQIGLVPLGEPQTTEGARP